MSTLLNTRIVLRNDTEANYELVRMALLPLEGEVCIVKTDSGLRFKVGDGSHYYGELPFADESNSIVLHGYYMNGEFYKDSTYVATAKLAKCAAHLYIDLNDGKKTNRFYVCDGSSYTPIDAQATSEIPGIMKLYETHGANEDGTITQKHITEGINGIKFAVDDSEEECLILNAPWA